MFSARTRCRTLNFGLTPGSSADAILRFTPSGTISTVSAGVAGTTPAAGMAARDFVRSDEPIAQELLNERA